MEEVAIIGAGAVGASYGSVFMKNGVHRFSFVANGKRAERLKKKVYALIMRYYIHILRPRKIMEKLNY